MAVEPRAQRLRAWALAPVLTFGVAVVGLNLGSQAFAADMQEEFEQRVQKYLAAHPEAAAEALNRWEAHQGEQEAAAERAALEAHATEVFHDPHSPVSGNPNGDVTLVEFFDYNCPYCGAMAPLLARAEAADSQLRIVYKEFPILGRDSLFAAKAALAANKQGKYVAFHRGLYQARGHVDAAKVLEVAGTVGVDVQRMQADMEDAVIADELDNNGKLGQALHITGTPGFVVGDQVATGATELKDLQLLIAKARAGHEAAK
jgi:protein-disulfide isomerase